RLLLGQLLRRQVAQFVVDQGQEFLRGGRVALFDGGQDVGDFARSHGVLAYPQPPPAPATKPAKKPFSGGRRAGKALSGTSRGTTALRRTANHRRSTSSRPASGRRRGQRRRCPPGETARPWPGSPA